MRWLVGVCVAALTACAGASDEPSRITQCERYRDHLVDLRFANAEHIDTSAQQAALKQALGDEFLAKCERSLSDSELACALRAIDSRGVLACSSTSRQPAR